MAADATYIRQLIAQGVALNQGPGLRRIVTRLTTISGPDDPQLNEKLGGLSPVVEQLLITRLAELLLSVP